MSMTGMLFALLLAAHPPVAIRVEVALCDAATQGVLPPANPRQCAAALPKENLYWGALYGVKTHLPKALGTRRVDIAITDEERAVGIVDRFILQTPAMTVTATAWSDMGAAMAAVLSPPAGTGLAVFVGHNGLMDMPVSSLSLPPSTSTAAVSVLACLSDRYFSEVIRSRGLTPYVMTKSLMAPEAYVVAAVVRAFADGKTDDDAVKDAVRAYAKFQNISVRSARTVFVSSVLQPSP